MDSNKKDAVYGKYIRKIEGFVKNTLADVEGAYKDTLTDKNAVAAIGIAAFTLIKALSPVMYLIFALLLSGTHLVLGTYPMGLAFLCAVGDRLMWAYVGAILGALIFTPSPAVEIAVYTLAVCLRRLTAIITEPERKLTDFEDGMKLKLIVSLISATALGAYNSITSDFSFASLGALLVYIAVTPSLAFLYACSVSSVKGDATVLYEETSRAALAVSLVWSCRSFSVGSIELSVIVAFILSLYVTRRHGILKGCLVSLFFGLSATPAMTPVYSIASVVSGMLFSSSPYLAAATSTLASVSWTVYAGGYSLVSDVAPSLILGGVITSVGVYGGFFASRDKKSDLSLPHSTVLRAEILKSKDTDALLSSEAKAFADLSEMLERLSERLSTPTLYDVKETVRKCRDSLCRRCEASEVCRKLNGPEIADAWDELAVSLYERGTLDEDSVPRTFTDSCRYADMIYESVSDAYANTVKNLIDTDKAEVMAVDYKAVASVLSDIIERRDGSFSIDSALSDALLKRLRTEKITVGGVTVYGIKRRTVFISSLRPGGLHIGEDDLRRIVSDVCGGEFSSPEFDLYGADINATLRETESFSVLHASQRLTEGESRACGDSCSLFQSKNGHFFALISDGMGSGSEAALTSGMCTLFIEKMLSAGNSASVTLKMLNSMLRAKGAECSATVDLCDFDLISGEIKFYKSGASPSLLIRKNDIYKIESRTLPVGIIRSLDAQKTKIDAEVGDVIVMFSDGVAEGDEDSAWLYSLLSKERDRKCADIANEIISETERRYAKKDDATVCVIRVTPPPYKDISF